MSPEQVRGEVADTRADIFSFGCVLYEMATGERAFACGNPIETLNAILHETPLPSRRRHELPSGFDRLVAHCLEKVCAARFQSAHDLEFVFSALTCGGHRLPSGHEPLRWLCCRSLISVPIRITSFSPTESPKTSSPTSLRSDRLR